MAKESDMMRCGSLLVLAGFLFTACSAEPLPPPPMIMISADQQQLYDDQSLALASVAIEQRRYKDADLIVRTVLRHDEDNPFANYLRAEILLSRGSTKNAEKQFAALADTAALRGRALQGQGIANLLMGRPVKAQNLLAAAVAENANLWRAWNALGAAYDVAEEYENADFAYTRALALQPDVADIYNNRGFSRLQRDDPDGAIEDFLKAIDLDPDFETAEMNLRLAYASKGMYVHALSGAVDAERQTVLNNTGYMAMLRGDYEAAENYLNAAMEERASFYRKAWKNLTYLSDVQTLESK